MMILSLFSIVLWIYISKYVYVVQHETKQNKNISDVHFPPPSRLLYPCSELLGPGPIYPRLKVEAKPLLSTLLPKSLFGLRIPHTGKHGGPMSQHRCVWILYFSALHKLVTEDSLACRWWFYPEVPTILTNSSTHWEHTDTAILEMLSVELELTEWTEGEIPRSHMSAGTLSQG